ncbi:ABC transporter ATP-binding protein [Marixanthomonas ophiurae]|uniref:ABC transporter ATP-binding protein n=1 Tax=Marixanthomonas ophiurae TaxID=387659 RepID=A0A3E1QD36_9FLAO|nr:ABC transporter ATP-binding protein [Marixanthomonas ophiurae]RFN60032.1 ABC transporter ATP-binding protein [Marixanthomonas ophiurae]
MTILKAENISKQYRLGLVGTGTLSHDLNRFWHQIRGKGDPYAKVGGVNDRSAKAKEDYVWALRDINFEVGKGDILGIIGKNGAGKSTLLKILSRVTGPTTGCIKTKGRIASLLEVGTGFHPELTGRENIYLNGAILGMTKAEIAAKEDEIIDFSGCAMYVDTPVKRYSSGMRVRLAFAVAAHLEPDILVVDEVLAVGDAEFQKKAIGKMQDISKGEGRTVLFVSHNMDSVQSLCTSGMVLDNGYTTFTGSATESVNFYTKKQLQKISSYKEFENKGNNFAKIHSIGVNKGSEYSSVSDDIIIELEFSILQESSKRIDASAAIINESDLTVSNVGTGLMDESPIEIIKNIPQKLVFHIEKPNLNSGVYGITIRFIENRAGRAKLRIDDIIFFQIKNIITDTIFVNNSSIIMPRFNVTHSK